jgi:integrase
MILNVTRNRYQEGSLRKVRRKSGAEVWEYRYRNHAEPGSPMRQKTFSVRDYPTESKMRRRLQEEKLRINDPESFREHNRPTFGLVLDRFETEERLEAIVKQPTGESTITGGFSWSTAAGYRSYIRTHVRQKWGSTPIAEMKPLDILEWLKALPLSAKTRGHVRALMHLLFERAMLWGLMDLQRNPVDVVKLRGTSKRQKKPHILTPEQFQTLLTCLHNPHRTMVMVAMCTGMRVSEVLALRWEHINFETGEMLVQQGVVNGRIGKVKTEASNDYIPLDPAFAEILLKWKGEATTGLVFPSPINGLCYNAGTIQQHILRPAFRKLGLLDKGLGWHTFRHTYRAFLDETGAPTGVQQKLMRHSNVATTMNVYGNATSKAKQEANSKVVQMVIAPQMPEAVAV